MFFSGILLCVSSSLYFIEKKKERKINNHKGTRDTIEGMYLSEVLAAGVRVT